MALAAIIHAPSLNYGFSHLDDTILILERQGLLLDAGKLFQSFWHTYFDTGDSYYRPLVTASYGLDARWSGSSPFGYHFTNVVLHIASTALLNRLLIRFAFEEWTASIGACLFAAHPALVQAVAWIPGRNDSLLCLFSLAAWLLLIADDRKPMPSTLAGHAACLSAALLTKETAVVLPFVFAVHLWSSHTAPSLSLLKRLWLPWILTLGGYTLVRTQIVTSPPEAGAEHVKNLISGLPVLISSLGTLCLPIHLSPIAVAQDTPLWPGLLSLAILGGLAWRLPADNRKIYALGAATFVLALLPSLFTADRLTLENRLYLPAVGLILFVANFVDPMMRRRARVALVVAVVILCCECITTLGYANSYRDRGAMAFAGAHESPHSALAASQLAQFLQTEKQDLDGAEQEYRRAIGIDVDERVVHNNLGVLLMRRGNLPEAETMFREELAINPGYAPAHYNLGLVLRRTSRPDQAAAEWEKALRCDPEHTDAMGELMVYYGQRGDKAKMAYFMDQLTRRGFKFTSLDRASP